MLPIGAPAAPTILPTVSRSLSVSSTVVVPLTDSGYADSQQSLTEVDGAPSVGASERINLTGLARQLQQATVSGGPGLPPLFGRFLAGVSAEHERANAGVAEQLLDAYVQALTKMAPDDIIELAADMTRHAERHPAMACLREVHDALAAADPPAGSAPCDGAGYGGIPDVASPASGQGVAAAPLQRRVSTAIRLACQRGAAALPTPRGAGGVLLRDVFSNGLPATLDNVIAISLRAARRQGLVSDPASVALAVLPAISVAMWMAHEARVHHDATGCRADTSQIVRAVFTTTVLAVPAALALLGGQAAVARSAATLMGVAAFASGRTLIDSFVPAGVKSRPSRGGLVLQVGFYAALQILVSRANYAVSRDIHPFVPPTQPPATWGDDFDDEFASGARLFMIAATLKIGLASLSNILNPVLNRMADLGALPDQPAATASTAPAAASAAGAAFRSAPALSGFDEPRGLTDWLADGWRNAKGAVPIVTATFLALTGVVVLAGEFRHSSDATPEGDQLYKELALAVGVWMFKPLADHLNLALSERPHPAAPPIRTLSVQPLTDSVDELVAVAAAPSPQGRSAEDVRTATPAFDYV